MVESPTRPKVRHIEEALPLLEEGIHLLRRLPAKGLFFYYLGTLPFVAALLFFATDLSLSALASKRLPRDALFLALLYFWMVTWQERFGLALRSEWSGLNESEVPRRTLTRLIALFLAKALGLVVLALGLPTLFLAGPAVSATSTLMLLHPDSQKKLGEILSSAFRYSSQWLWQMHKLLGILGLFSLFVLVDASAGVLLVPELFKTLSGFSFSFQRLEDGLMSSTLFWVAGSITYLIVHPVLLACFALKLFRLEARATGEDLRVGLRRLSWEAPLLLLGLILFGASTPATAAPNAAVSNGAVSDAAVSDAAVSDGATSDGAVSDGATSDAAKTATSSQRLQAKGSSESSLKGRRLSPEAITETLGEVTSEREYAWRRPKEIVPTREEELTGWAAKVRDALQKVSDTLKDLWEKFREWLSELFRAPPPRLEEPETLERTSSSMKILTMVLLAAVGAALGVLLYRLYKRLPEESGVVAVPATVARPDVRDEGVSPDALPTDEWLRLAHELEAKGEYRLALRARYLSCLSSLAQAHLIDVARFKSNFDYLLEVKRKGHALASVPETFAALVFEFERSWYGEYPATAEGNQAFAAEMGRMASYVSA